MDVVAAGRQAVIHRIAVVHRLLVAADRMAWSA
jgi:hypothetical protein